MDIKVEETIVIQSEEDIKEYLEAFEIESRINEK